MHQIAIIFRFARLFYGILYWILNDARENKHEFFTGNYIPFIYQPRTAGCAFRIAMAEDVSGISGSGLILPVQSPMIIALGTILSSLLSDRAYQKIWHRSSNGNQCWNHGICTLGIFHQSQLLDAVHLGDSLWTWSGECGCFFE